MKFEKTIALPGGKGTAALHIVNDNVVVNGKKKAIRGSILSYASTDMDQNFENGAVRPIKNTEFTILDTDTVNWETSIQKYLDVNLEAVITGVVK